MRKFDLLGATALALLAAAPAFSQESTQSGGATQSASSDVGIADIVVTAQRQAERLQDVPIAVSALSGETLQTQQIQNATQLQLSLPNVTFTKTNFTASSFTIRGIGDLCVGFSCDQATAIHVNDQPVPSTRLFETEYFDLERVEVLRGPQGTLFGRNASSGVVNFITARPNLAKFGASGQVEYGNYDSIRVQGMVNLPLTNTIGARLAGYYLNRNGYTRNLFDNSRVDGRDLYAVRGTLRWEPSPDTTLDLIGYYFRERDDRSRIQKQLCNRDPTGVLGCLPDRLENETVNANATFASILSSREFFGLQSTPTAPNVNGPLTPFGIRSIYGADSFAGFVQPNGLRTVNTNVAPTYFSSELLVQARLEQNLGETLGLVVTGGYDESRVNSKSGYFLNTPDSLAGNVGMGTFRFASSAPGSPFAPGAAAIFDSSGNLCSSIADRSYTGALGGNKGTCQAQPLNYDRSRSSNKGWSVEGHIDSSFDGPINFLLGGIYLSGKTEGDYFVVQDEGNYISAVLGGATTSAQRAAGNAAFPNVFLAPPFFNSETQRYRLKSYGIFGEVYFNLTDNLKLTGGLRYSNDKKFVRDRSPLLNFPVPYGVTNAFDSPFAGAADFDASIPGVQPYREARVGFDEITGRFVVDWKPHEDMLFYASYSRGYKSGGINPPFDPNIFSAPATFRPEIINAYEIGTKNTFANGTVRLNASAFFYDYKDLQLSRILNRTSFNDNTNAKIYGVELEALLKPSRSLLFNLSGSFLRTKIQSFQLVDTRDPSGGRSDTVIIKDLTNAANCVVRPTVDGNALGANTLVAAFNGALGLRGPTPIPGTNTTGAYSICSALAATIQNPSAPLRALFQTPTGPLPFLFNTNAAGAATGLPDGVPVDLSGNSLPNAPKWKFAAGAQHTFDFDNGMNLVTRADLNFTGDYFSRSFNRSIDRIEAYEVVNISVTLNGPDERWFVRGFVQNLTKNNAITGQYVTDPSTGLFTNVFTLEPRRYGIAAGFKF